MIPRTLSASSLQVAESCLARWGAENFNRASQPGGAAANVGTSVHYALEMIVKLCYIDRTHEASMDLILDMYKMGYMQTFDTANMDTDEFRDGLELVKKWYKRTSFDGFKVISAEQKSTFPIKTSAGDIPFNYIWDRCDELPDGTIRIVDYKTIRVPVTAQGLREKIQPRCYGLAGQIQFPDAPRIMVEFDLLRHERVGIVFSREDNIATWTYLKKSAERLIASDENNLPETLNTECRYCVRKHSCETLNKNIHAGGVFAVSPDDAVDRRAELAATLAAGKLMLDELDGIILKHAEKEMLLEWETKRTKVSISARSTRGADFERISKIIGPELVSRYGKMNMGDLDKLIKSPSEITEEQKTKLKSLIYRTTGEPSVKVSPLSPLDDD